MATTVGMGATPKKKDTDTKLIKELRAQLKTLSDEMGLKTKELGEMAETNTALVAENEALKQEVVELAGSDKK